jgi:hypothetical protein
MSIVESMQSDSEHVRAIKDQAGILEDSLRHEVDSRLITPVDVLLGSQRFVLAVTYIFPIQDREGLSLSTHAAE